MTNTRPRGLRIWYNPMSQFLMDCWVNNADRIHKGPLSHEVTSLSDYCSLKLAGNEPRSTLMYFPIYLPLAHVYVA
jgi:hypothetical protein